MHYVLPGLVQSALLILIAPLVEGIVKKLKAVLQGRQGAPVLQPYYDLYKYFQKDSVVSTNASWLFRFTPYLVFGVMITISTFLPAIFAGSLFSQSGDFVFIMYLLALARIFTALAGVDSGSSFGSMGSSRDLFLSVLEEPVLFVTMIGIALWVKTTNMTSIVAGVTENVHILQSPSYYMIVAAFLILVLSETGRRPVDNPDTHLELTMIHEGILLEYSGKLLALMKWGSWLKQVLLYTLFIDFCIPFGIAKSLDFTIVLYACLLFAVKLFFITFLIAAVELTYAKLQLMRVQRFLSAAFMLSLFAIAIEYL
jgi:formate hydrogenlyase subunit 4